MKKRWPIAGLAVAAVIAGLCVFLPEIRVPILQETVQSKIAAKVPLEKAIAGVTATVTAADVEFTDGFAEVTGSIDLTGFGYGGTAVVSAATGLHYVSSEGAFYLNEVSADDIVLTLDEKTDKAVSGLGGTLMGMASRAKEKLAGADEESALSRIAKSKMVAGMADKAAGLADGPVREKAMAAAQSAFSAAVRMTPVYTLEKAGFMGTAVQLALKDVVFEPGRVVAVLEPGTAIIRILGWVLAFVFAVLSTLGLIFGSAGRGSQGGGIDITDLI